MNDDEKIISTVFAKAEIPFTAVQIAQCSRYAFLLREKNKVMNLTAITEMQEVAVKHFCDSLMLPKFVSIPAGASIIDIGSGAGFPGLPFGIMLPKVSVTLLDSLEKRCGFLQEIVDDLGLTNISVVWSRAEDAGRNEELREHFDFATARAVASLPMLLEYAFPFLKVGGAFLPLKGKAEETSFAHALDVLGGFLEEEIQYTLPIAEEERRIYNFRKTDLTAEKYPRNAGKIKKMPL